MKMKLIPMHSYTGDTDDLERDNFIFEPKLDGIRALCIVSLKTMRFVSRSGLSLTATYPEFDFRKQIKAKTCVLDGEIVVFDKKGNPDFNLLQNKKNSHALATYVVFDILNKNGVSLLEQPLEKRKKIIAKTIIEGNNLETIAYTTNGRKLWSEVKKHHLEGVMAKCATSSYHPGIRSHDWLKIKITHTLDCIIVGYTQEKRAISSLALGIYKDKKLIFIGKVGTGFNQASIKELYEKLSKIKRQTPPVINPEEHIIWTSPRFVCEVECLMITKDNKLRAPVFIRLRTDKKPQECREE